jgi:hypothetical protein
MDPEALVFVGEGDPVAVGRGDAGVAEDGAVGGELDRSAEPVGGQAPEFQFPGFVGQREDGLAVGEESGVAVADAGGAGDFDQTAGLDGCYEHLAAGGERHAVALGGEVCRGQILEGFADPAFAEVIEVGGQGDGDLDIGGVGEGEQAEVGAELVGDAALVKGG